MPRLESLPKIKYTCSCGAVSSAEVKEFRSRNTMPPTYVAKCAFCNLGVVCSPKALIHKEVGELSNAQALTYFLERY